MGLVFNVEESELSIDYYENAEALEAKEPSNYKGWFVVDVEQSNYEVALQWCEDHDYTLIKVRFIRSSFGNA